MSDEELLVAPKRLRDGDDEIARVLREHQELWDAAQRRARPSRGQFAALAAKRDRVLLVRSGLGMSAAAVAILGLTSYFQWHAQLEDNQQLVAAPDKMLVSPTTPRALRETEQPKNGGTVPAPSGLDTAGTDAAISVAAPAPVAATAPTGVHARAPADGHAPTGLPSIADAEPHLPRPVSSSHPASAGSTQQSSAAMPSAAVDVDAHRSARAVSHRDCHRLAYADARACYTQISQGSGVTAELAYLERARLEQQQGGDSASALRSLDEYQRRFPRGTLQPEATLARIRLLVSTHHNREARAAIAEALPKMPEKAAVLREVAVDLAVIAGDCAQASQLLKQIPTELTTPSWKAAHLGRCAAVDP